MSKDLQRILLRISALLIVSSIAVWALPDTANAHVARELSMAPTSDHPQPHGVSEDHVHPHDHDAAHDEGGHHGPDTAPLFFIIIAVFIGAATRHFLKSIPVPFTALLLIIGIALGVLTRLGSFEMWGPVDVSFIADAFRWASHIDPHMLFFVFLPILIFEAAFAMDLHTFKKTATNSVILAVPGIIIALLLTGVLVFAIDYFNWGLEGWANWSLAFMFGSVISATDPVAVVALLKELGASKKLGTLIEGESLLNDGTAIVLFMVFFLGISGEASDANGFVEFFRVALGGVGVGLFVGWVILRWLKGVFNDAMVEISAVVAAAYITFYIAENFLHVSGVLALVALGLLIGGFGRSSISPQVEHFMHEFWELAGFIANCLIFLIVGFVIAQRTEFSANDFLVLGIIYVGVHIVRAIVIVIHYPFMKNAGYGLPVKDAIVVWYGALRGAIGLALALIVAGVDSEIMARTLDTTPELATKIKEQFLFLIAGTVTLTLLVNATTIKALVQKLGMLDLAPVKALALKASSDYLRSSTENHMQKLKEDRNLRKANWSTVAEYLPREINLVANMDETGLEVAKIAEQRRRLLEKEKSSYWKQFKEGMLGPVAVRTLSDTVNDILDAKGEISLSNRKDLELLWQPPKWLLIVQRWPIIGKITEDSFFNKLAVSYDCAVGFVSAQEDCLGLLESMYRAEDAGERANLEKIEQEINENIISGQTFMRNLRNTYPEIYRAISTRQAIRSVLNYELHTVERLRSKGRLDGSETARMKSDIEVRMKKLMERPPSVELPETGELIDSIHWFRDMPAAMVDRVRDLCQTKVFANGQTMLKAGKSSQGLFIIARGSVRVLEGNTTIDVVSKGDLLGELAILTGQSGRHSATSETPVTALWLSANNVQRLMNEFSAFSDLLWKVGSIPLVANALAKDVRFRSMDAKHLRKIAGDGKIAALKKGGRLQIPQGGVGVVISGQLSAGGAEVGGLMVLPASEGVAMEDSQVWTLEVWSAE